MAIHDYNLANQVGSDARADLNLLFQAIVSNNSFATEPTTLFAYMWWVDTTTGLLKQRNAANTAWITIGTLATTNLGLALVGGSASQTFSVATATAAAHSVRLDQFETITNPVLTLSGSTGNPTTPVTAVSTYTVNGKFATVSVTFTNVNTTGATGNLQITGLPNTVVGTTTLGQIIASGFGATPFTCIAIGTSIQILDLTGLNIVMSAGTSKYLDVTLRYQITA